MQETTFFAPGQSKIRIHVCSFFLHQKVIYVSCHAPKEIINIWTSWKSNFERKNINVPSKLVVSPQCLTILDASIIYIGEVLTAFLCKTFQTFQSCTITRFNLRLISALKWQYFCVDSPLCVKYVCFRLLCLKSEMSSFFLCLYSGTFCI